MKPAFVKRYRLLWSLNCLILLLVAHSANALEFAIGEKDLNLFVQKAFPIKEAYQGADVYLSEPNLTLDGLDNRLTIKVKMTAIRGSEILEASAEVRGKVTYESVDYVLQLEEPSLHKFKVLENTMQDANPLIRGMRDVVGKSLPVIALIDLSQFDSGFGKLRPKDIHIKHKRLVIVL